MENKSEAPAGKKVAPERMENNYFLSAGKNGKELLYFQWWPLFPLGTNLVEHVHLPCIIAITSKSWLKHKT